MKTKYIIRIIILGVIFYILIHFRYKVVKTLPYNDKKVEIVMDRWRSGIKSFFLNNLAGMHYAPYYKVVYNDKDILKIKLNFRPDEYGVDICEFATNIKDSDMYIYISEFSSLYKIKLPLNNKLNKISDLEVESYSRESNNEFNKKCIYTFIDGSTLIYYYKIKGEKAQKWLHDLAEDY